MLRAFFRAEMPDPWPLPPATELPCHLAVERPWWKRTGRVALAASVGLILIGYLALASGFPRSAVVGPSGLTPEGGSIGKEQLLSPKRLGPRPKNLIRMQTPDGRPVLIEESKGNDGRFFLKAEFTTEPKGKR
jgi:hypothetical protein